MNKLESLVKLVELVDGNNSEATVSSKETEQYIGKQLIIAQRGWVFVGSTYRKGDEIILKDCYNVRKWTGEQGLGYYCINGNDTTIELDKYTNMTFHKLSIVGRADINEENWDIWK